MYKGVQPSEEIELTVRDVSWDNLNETLVVWVGSIASVTLPQEDRAEINCTSLEASMQRNGLMRTYSGALVGSSTGITGTSWTWTDNLGSYEGLLKIRLWAVRDGLESYQAHEVTVRREPPATGPLTADRTDVTADQSDITVDQTEY